MPFWVLGPPIKIVRKASNQSVSNSTTLVNAACLSFSVAACETRAFSMNLFYSGDACADIKFAFTQPACSTLWWQSTDTIQTAQVDCAVDNVAVPGACAIGALNWTGVIKNGNTAGTVQLQFAQLSAQCACTILRQDSNITHWKLA